MPCASCPGTSVDRAAVVDAFFTDTAEAADLVLPVALMLEEDDVVGGLPASLRGPGVAFYDQQVRLVPIPA